MSNHLYIAPNWRDAGFLWSPLVVYIFLCSILSHVLRPGEEVIQEVQTGIVHVLWDLGQQVLQIVVDLLFARRGGFCQAVNNGTAFGNLGGDHDMSVGVTQSERKDRLLCGSVLNGYPSVLLV